MQTASENQFVENLFTNGRHLNMSFSSVKIYFFMGKKSITISLNSTYIMVFKNPRDHTQIRHLACQMFPSKPKFEYSTLCQETICYYVIPNRVGINWG